MNETLETSVAKSRVQQELDCRSGSSGFCRRRSPSATPEAEVQVKMRDTSGTDICSAHSATGEAAHDVESVDSEYGSAHRRRRERTAFLTQVRLRVVYKKKRSGAGLSCCR